MTKKRLEKVLSGYGIVEKDEKENIIGLKVEGLKEIISIDELYNGQLVEPDTSISAEDIEKIQDKSSIYGKVVTNYTVGDSTLQSELDTAGIRWKVYYAGSDFSIDRKSYIYLIAEDYIPYESIPKTKGNNSLIKGDYARAAHWSDTILDDYTGSANITDSVIRKLNNSYFSQGFTSTNNNWKSVEYMLDTSLWSTYKGSKAKYAIGGPTVEMLMKSYSQVYNVEYKAKASSATGYQISCDGGATWKNYMSDYSEYLNRDDSLYVIESYSNAYAHWLASASNQNGVDLVVIGYDGTVTCNDYTYRNPGFRPLVCLESNARLEKQLDGTFKIK